MLFFFSGKKSALGLELKHVQEDHDRLMERHSALLTDMASKVENLIINAASCKIAWFKHTAVKSLENHATFHEAEPIIEFFIVTGKTIKRKTGSPP